MGGLLCGMPMQVFRRVRQRSAYEEAKASGYAEEVDGSMSDGRSASTTDDQLCCIGEEDEEG